MRIKFGKTQMKLSFVNFLNKSNQIAASNGSIRRIATLIDGKALAKRVLDDCRKEMEELKKKYPKFQLNLAIVQVIHSLLI